MIRIENLYKIYNDFNALDNVCLEIDKGEFVVLTGNSGSGKSTLLNIIGLIDVATRGKTFLDNKQTTSLNEKEKCILRN